MEKVYVHSFDELLEFELVEDRPRSWVVRRSDRDGRGLLKISKGDQENFASTDRDEVLKRVLAFIDGKIEEYRGYIDLYEAEKARLIEAKE